MTINRVIDGAPASTDDLHQGAGRWARRGAERLAMPVGDSGDDEDGTTGPPTAGHAEPDISPSLAGGHASSAHHPD